MQFTDLLEEFLAAKKIVDDLREKYNENPYKYNCSFNEVFYSECSRYTEARESLNSYVERKSLSDMRFGG